MAIELVDPAPQYTAEIRFGVVMYGGVSLAIYINGVTNELFEMACATPRDGVRLAPPDEPYTRGIYRRLAWLIGNPTLRTQYAQAIRQAILQAKLAAEGKDPDDVWQQIDTKGSTKTRLAIDVIAGTSAGGINGVFLAKALANGEQFSGLKDLWVNEGDIALLLNDEKSYDTKAPVIDKARSKKPTSLLNSDRMYAKLFNALGSMAPLAGLSGQPIGGGTSPLVDEIDLHVTTTDIRGSAVPLRLFDKVVYERRYKQSYHFRYPNMDASVAGNDFEASNTAFLAFAARCTSSFPFAFEPMTLSAVTRLKVVDDVPGVLRWNAFFPDLPRAEVRAGQHVHRAFGDGGYLDNKPFTYVVEALSGRFSSVPMERKLVFVEPSPEEFDPHAVPDPEQMPDALENSLAALMGIPRYESIREDLQAVLARNRRIERVERVVRLGELRVNPSDPFSVKLNAEGKIPTWSTLKLSDMVAYYGTAFIPYQRLRIYAVTDALADRLGVRWGIDGQSDEQYALRALVRVWRDRNFSDDGGPETDPQRKETVNAYLDQFDLDYRLRRLGFLLRKIDQLTRLFHRRMRGALGSPEGAKEADGSAPALSEEEEQLLKALPAPFELLPASLPAANIEAAARILACLKKGLLHARARLLEASHLLTVPRAKAQASEEDKDKDKLRADLHAILMQVLGRVDVETATSVGAILKPDLLRAASATRTLQESVMMRAHAVYDAAEGAPQTPLQTRLIQGIDSMRMRRATKPTGEGDTEPKLESASRLAWHVLGQPTLAINRETNKVAVEVKQTTTEGLDGALDRGCIEELNSSSGLALRKFLGTYYLRFDTYDQMSFPLYYDTGTGEPSTVEVVRISPVDATNLIDEEKDPQHRAKLAGTALANFGAFLDRRWRLNDIMWGRLDGAERIIQALLPMTDDDTATVRKELIERAQRSILREALLPEGHATLADLVVKALDESAKGTSGTSGTSAEKMKELFAKLWKGNSVARERLGGVLVSLLSEPGLMEYMRNTRQIDPEPDPEATLKSAARAVTITGRVLERISDSRDAGKTVPRWLARLGLMLQGIVAVSVPGTLRQRWWSHGVKILYAFEAFLIVVALVFGSEDMRSLAVTAFAATLAIHLLTWIAEDLMRQTKRALYWVAAGILFVTVCLAAVGALTLVHQGMQQTLCWSHPSHIESEALASKLCGTVGDLQEWWFGRRP